MLSVQRRKNKRRRKRSNMNDDDFKNIVATIIRHIDTKKMADDCWRLWKSGAIDHEDVTAELAPKACVHVVLKELANSLRPLSAVGRAMVRNLEHF